MQFCLLHIDYSEARLTCFEIDRGFSYSLAESPQGFNIRWTDKQNLITEDEENQGNFLLELLQRNLERIADPLIVQVGASHGELYSLSFPFADIKKIRQVINPEIEDLLPFEPDFQTTNVSINLKVISGSATSAKVILLSKELLKKLIDETQLLGCICPLFLYQPLVTESLLADRIKEPFICIEFDYANSYLYIFSGPEKGITERPLVLTSDLHTLQELIMAQLAQSDATDIKKIILINKTDLEIDTLFTSSTWDRTIINPVHFIPNIEQDDSPSSSSLASSILGALAIGEEIERLDELDDTNFKNVRLFNLREGEFKYRAPFSDFKENLFSEIVPLSLTAFFLIFYIVLGFITPLKELSIIDSQAKELLKVAAPDLGTLSGKPLDILANEIINLEGQIGGLTTMRSLSPFDWLYKLSIGLKADASIALETLSITSSGITFRGTVPDYPTSGRLDGMLKTMLKENQGLICKGEVNSEQGSSAQKVSITGVLELCQ